MPAVFLILSLWHSSQHEFSRGQLYVAYWQSFPQIVVSLIFLVIQKCQKGLFSHTAYKPESILVWQTLISIKDTVLTCSVSFKKAHDT